jgi:hypothetical protein
MSTESKTVKRVEFSSTLLSHHKANLADCEKCLLEAINSLHSDCGKEHLVTTTQAAEYFYSLQRSRRALESALNRITKEMQG